LPFIGLILIIIIIISERHLGGSQNLTDIGESQWEKARVVIDQEDWNETAI